MILVCCVDNSLGLRFNHRRQSRDRELSRRILEKSGGEVWLAEKSRAFFEQLPEEALHIIDTPAQTPQGKWCFWEEKCPEETEPEEIVLYLWNRDYPADEHFAFPGGKENWSLREKEDFSGYSHPVITEMRFQKKE